MPVALPLTVKRYKRTEVTFGVTVAGIVGKVLICWTRPEPAAVKVALPGQGAAGEQVSEIADTVLDG